VTTATVEAASPAVVKLFLDLDDDDKLAFWSDLDRDERLTLWRGIRTLLGRDAWAAMWRTDPVGFIEYGLEESLWSAQRTIAELVRDNKRTAVPACHSPGKSHLAARLVAWWVMCHPIGTAQVVTTSTTFRQVRNILWPHIRRLRARHQLDGWVGMVEWQMDGDIVAFGFSPSDDSEASMQGIHAPHLLVIVDEAGGIPSTLGDALEALMTGEHTRLLLIGNPPTEQEASWFERKTTSPLYVTYRLGAFDTPNFTGEPTGICTTCPPLLGEHRISQHLVDQAWVEDVVEEFGAESPFVEARVHARFPTGVANKVIPREWLEAAQTAEPQEGQLVRLGVDVAADGGDELAVAQADGWTAKLIHTSSGAVNADPVAVAGRLLEFVQAADRLHAERGITDPVRVKVDAIGVGWGVAGLLRTWGQEGKHRAEIVDVVVGQKAKDGDHFVNQRAEMWWNLRRLLNPSDPTTRLELDKTTFEQLAAPLYQADSSGRIQIERKKDLKKRGMPSPDRGEAILLALFDPGGVVLPDELPVSLTQSNEWNL